MATRIQFTNSAVLVQDDYTGSTPLYTALSFLRSQSESATEAEATAEPAIAIIYTPTQSIYPKSSQDSIELEDGLNWRMDDEEMEEVYGEKRTGKTKEKRDTKLMVDEWFKQNGLKGDNAKLLNRVQIVRVDSLSQLAICLATYPSPSLNQERTTGNVLFILHDITLLPPHPPEDESSTEPLTSSTGSPIRHRSTSTSHRSPSRAPSEVPFFPPPSPEKEEEREGKGLEGYLLVVTYALAAMGMAGQGSKFVLFEYRFDGVTKSILGSYLQEEKIA